VPAQTAWTSPACSNASVARIGDCTATTQHMQWYQKQHDIPASNPTGAYLKYASSADTTSLHTRMGYSCAADLTVLADVTFTWPHSVQQYPAAADPSDVSSTP
jgi:hypothetical protein